MSLQVSYRFIAPFYDSFLSRATASARQRSLSRLPTHGSSKILLSGAGTGLDFPYLPDNHHYIALDFTAAMLALSHQRASKLQMSWVQGDSMALPFAAGYFDYVILHLIVAVVTQPERCLAEAARVLKPGGRIYIFDKFLRPGERALLRKALSKVVAKLATRLDVVFEDVLAQSPNLKVVSDQPVMAGGWFRLIELEKATGGGVA